MNKFFYRFTKRLFDICSSMIALIVLLPLFLITSIGIKLSSEGPIFYRAERVGKNGKTFTLYKFRSMHVYKPIENKKGEQREGGYIANENRIFPFGSFIRKCKIDELPQLINVLLGQMSVIGPRPITKAGVQKHYIGKYDEVLTVKPGLACLDSLYDYAHGELVVKDNEEFDKKVAPVRDYLASMYVAKRNIFLDVYCIFRTLQLIFEISVQKKRDFKLTRYELDAERVVLLKNKKD